jgi:hypothetical protein
MRPFAKEAWFRRHAQETTATLTGYRQRASERAAASFSTTPAPAPSALLGPVAPSSSALVSAAVLPVPSSSVVALLTTTSPAARSSSVVPSPSLLPLRQVQPAPSNSPAVPSPASEVAVVPEVVASVRSCFVLNCAPSADLFACFRRHLRRPLPLVSSVLGLMMARARARVVMAPMTGIGSSHGFR